MSVTDVRDDVVAVEHRPLGGVNRTRRVVYEVISELRHGLNGTPRREPTGDEVF